MDRKTRICFTGHMSSSFVKNDFKFLKKHFCLKYVEPEKKLRFSRYLIKLAKNVKSCDMTYSWFADWNAFFVVLLSKIFRKKSVVIVGGYDAAFEPKIKYGAFTNLKERIAAKYVLKNAKLLLPVSEFVKKEILNKVSPKRLQVVYNGVDVDKYDEYSGFKKEIIITVGIVNRSNLIRKGLETFAKASNLLPDKKFIIVGKIEDNSIDYLKSIASSNFELTGFISDEELIDLYKKSKVICQLSYYEAFGLAPAEGMLFGCIPVVTKERAGLPEFVGNLGFYTNYCDEKEVAQAIRNALSAEGEKRRKVRERIISDFSLSKREKKIVKIINDLV